MPRMKTLDQINEDICQIVEARLERCREAGMFDFVDEEGNNRLKVDMRKVFADTEISLKFCQLFALAEKLEEYLQHNSTAVEQDALRDELKERLNSI